MRNILDRSLLVLLLGYSLCLVAGTLWPFDFTTDPLALARRPEPIEWIPFTYVCPHCIYSAKNKILNWVMFMPFGFSLGLLLIRSGRWLRRTLTIATSTGLAFSLAIECAQFFLPTRTPSASDLLLNTAGAFYGGCFAWLTVQAARRFAPWRVPPCHAPEAPAQSETDAGTGINGKPEG